MPAASMSPSSAAGSPRLSGCACMSANPGTTKRPRPSTVAGSRSGPAVAPIPVIRPPSIRTSWWAVTEPSRGSTTATSAMRYIGISSKIGNNFVHYIRERDDGWVSPPPATRRRGPALTEAIYLATLDELIRDGFADLSFDKIAKAAGTGKAALYRRWAGPEDLVLAALTDPGTGF